MAEYRRLLGKIEYVGTGFLGWQNQPQGPTIQSVIEGAIIKLVGTRLPILAPSRTDAGVHALGQLFCVDLPNHFNIKLKSLFFGINSKLPSSISLRDLIEVPPDFNIKENTGKSYRYRIWQGAYPSALLDWNHWWVKHPLDLQAMQEAANYCLGTHDFTAFRGRGCQAPIRIKTLTKLDIQTTPYGEGDIFELHIQGDHFLRKMIRIMVGTLVDVGWNRRDPKSIQTLLEQKIRHACGQTAPAKGLLLEEIYYAQDPFASRGLVGWENDPPKKT